MVIKSDSHNNEIRSIFPLINEGDNIYINRKVAAPAPAFPVIAK